MCLARGAYARCPLVLLDDPLSAVDAPCAEQLLHSCILGLLKDRAVVLATSNTANTQVPPGL